MLSIYVQIIQNMFMEFSPFERMIELKTKFISFGIPINENCSQVHHAEFNMGVPIDI